jgi:hypothetical protein
LQVRIGTGYPVPGRRGHHREQQHPNPTPYFRTRKPNRAASVIWQGWTPLQKQSAPSTPPWGIPTATRMWATSSMAGPQGDYGSRGGPRRSGSAPLHPFSALSAPLPPSVFCIPCPPSLLVLLHSLPPFPPSPALVAFLPPSCSCARCPPSPLRFLHSLPSFPSFFCTCCLPPSLLFLRSLPPCFLFFCIFALFFAPAVPTPLAEGGRGTARAKDLELRGNGKEEGRGTVSAQQEEVRG